MASAAWAQTGSRESSTAPLRVAMDEFEFMLGSLESSMGIGTVWAGTDGDSGATEARPMCVPGANQHLRRAISMELMQVVGQSPDFFVAERFGGFVHQTVHAVVS